jgi:hypothetical protein
MTPSIMYRPAASQMQVLSHTGRFVAHMERGEFGGGTIGCRAGEEAIDERRRLVSLIRDSRDFLSRLR